MLRDPSLIPLSRQHHNCLAFCVLTRRSLALDSSPANIETLARSAMDRYELELANHFEIEEQLLFPAARRHGGDMPLIASLIADHRALERHIADLRGAPSIQTLQAFMDLLTSHIRREESEFFEQIQRSIPPEVLLSLGQDIEAKAVRICL